MARTTASRSKPTVLENVTTLVGDHHREIVWIGGLLASTFSIVSLVGWTATDPTWLHPGDGAVSNPCGPVGALLADTLYQSVGVGAWITFLGMVACVLAIAGRPAPKAGRLATLAAAYVTALAFAELVAGPGDAFPPGGIVGAGLIGGLRSTVGGAGAWLAVAGAGLVVVTLLFRIRWGRVASRGVGVVEKAVPWITSHAVHAGHQAGGASAQVAQVVGKQVGVAARGAAGGAVGTIQRMQQSFRRRDDDPGSSLVDVPSSSGFEDADDEVPASEVDATVAGAGAMLAEVQWVPTEQEPASQELLGMFPDLTPRITSSGPGTRTGIERDREEPTRPSDPTRDPISGLEEADPEFEERTPSSAPVRASQPPRSAMVQVEETPAPAPPRDLNRTLVPAPDPGAGVRLPEKPVIGAAVRRSAFLDAKVRDDGGAVGKQKGPFVLPKLALLDPVPPQQATFDPENLRLMAVRVEETLTSFKVVGEVQDVRVGPVVTTLEFLPEKGISVRKVSSLADDLAMGLCATSVRIVAPIPGKGVVGIEIPSEQRLTIYLRELLAADEFRNSKMALPIVLGKDVEGAPVVADLARAPHLLVGGTTGSGKSVGVNGMLMSLLFRKTPDELRLLLVDPKKLEFKPYEDIPHLLHPVVTEPKKAAAALAWACREMDQRYEILARFDTRNIEGYNKKVEELVDNGWSDDMARRYAPPNWSAHEPVPRPEKLPYIVIVIDELADLMLVAKKEVEGSIARLTQMARACGIHLVVATQRPSVDVVTGLIKSNLPTRISFKLRSGTDSRTILDQIGAESLLGRGDSLYLPNAGEISRVHGPFVSDDEVNRVMDHLRQQGKPHYIASVTAEASEKGEDGGGDDDENDPMYDEAVQIVRQIGKASTSLVQRHLKIGYNRAARLVEIMEHRGVVGPADGARPREVLPA